MTFLPRYSMHNHVLEVSVKFFSGKNSETPSWTITCYEVIGAHSFFSVSEPNQTGAPQLRFYAWLNEHVILGMSFYFILLYFAGVLNETTFPLALTISHLKSIGHSWNNCSLASSLYENIQHWMVQFPLGNNFNTFLAVAGKWSRWSPWTDCSLTCGRGGQSRSRICSDKVTGKALKNGWCAGKRKQEKVCADWKCPGTFTNHLRIIAVYGGYLKENIDWTIYCKFYNRNWTVNSYDRWIQARCANFL